ncbi:DMT family transporter [Aeromonas sp. BIGb0445]|jgi:drug/metabolite transporter (DMT)-like permease|uniref:DMT family transporter n=1 Tax=Aeromonas sp. BIGb0445 TaxID=2940593 RepID=UPI0021694749|nr:DMT family transporter [Aeromonas sp. BIGb0445]MCS3460802.1 drug/metabolite transporter (DMT)-like permease [Aeromonas sp. BIGb0445]
MLKNQKRAYQYGLCAVALWSTVATAFKLSLRYFEPVQLLLVAALTSTLALGALVLKQGKLPLLGLYLRERPLYYLALGTLNPFLYYLLLFKAYDLLPAQQAQTINYTWAISLSLLAVPFLGQKLRRRDGVAILLGYFGALVIATKGDLLGLQFDSPLGVGLALLSTLIWAGYWILNTRNQGDPIVSLLLGFLLSLPLILVATWWLADFRMTAWQGWAGAIYVGLFEMGFGFVLWLMAMRSATDTAPLSNLIFISPFASLILLNLLIGEEIHPATPIGLALIVIALLVQQLKYGKRYRQPATPDA